nr:hypothetical protein Itr_chr02CG11530 [Ipomoea trifida]GLL19665.1 hypothetical protein Itr_chr02CG11540 [Ipomoea trifida]
MRMNGPEPYDGSGARSGTLPLCLRRRSSSDDVKDGQHRAAAWMVGGECSGSGGTGDLFADVSSITSVAVFPQKLQGWAESEGSVGGGCERRGDGRPPAG